MVPVVFPGGDGAENGLESVLALVVFAALGTGGFHASMEVRYFCLFFISLLSTIDGACCLTIADSNDRRLS